MEKKKIVIYSRNKERKKISIPKEREKKDEEISQERQIFDLKQLLELSKSLNSMIEFHHLVDSILYMSMSQMKTVGVALFSKQNFDSARFVLHKNFYGFDIKDHTNYAITEDDEIVSFFEDYNLCITPHELKKRVKLSKALQALLTIEPSLFVPLVAKKHLVGFLLLGEQIDKNGIYSKYEKDLIMNIATLAAIALHNALLLERSTTDLMTHLKLKDYFYTILREKIETIPHSIPLSILMLDIDFFKSVNDIYGHACGDLVLKEVARVIRLCINQKDLPARFGGEEFIVMLYKSDWHHAIRIAERIRDLVEHLYLMYNEKQIKITISIGVAQYLFGQESMKDLIERADIALYRSKNTGRNKISISEQNCNV